MAMLIGLNLNLSKIDKTKIKDVNGAKYLNLTVSVNDQQDNYGKDVAAWHEQSQGERDSKAKKEYLGNGKVLFKKEAEPHVQAPKQDPQGGDGLPF